MLLAVGVVLGVLVPTAAPGQVGNASVQGSGRVIGKLDRFPADALAALGPDIAPPPEAVGDQRREYSGTILLFPEVRQLWQLYLTKIYGGGTYVLVRDLDTMKAIKTFHIPYDIANSGEWPHTTDPGRSVFFVTNLRKVVQVDFATSSVTLHRFDGLFEWGGFAGIALSGLTYDPTGNAVLGVWSQFANLAQADSTTYLSRLDLDTGEWQVRIVRSCTGPSPSTTGGGKVPVLTTDGYVVVPCTRAGQAAIAVKIARADLMAPGSLEDVAVGPMYLTDVLLDSPGRRLLMSTFAGELWSFDGENMAFVGVVASSMNESHKPQLGVDQASGRVFFRSRDRGLGVIEGRFFPLPQPQLHSAFAGVEGDADLWSDSATGRLFVLDGLLSERASSYLIVDVGKAPAPPPPPDPDRNTVDRAEQAGVTDSRYFGNGSGYGARAILANGIVPVVPAPTIFHMAPTAQLFADRVAPKCGFTDREFFAARVAKTEYDNSSTSAEAASIVLDDRTKLDLDRPSRCDVTVRGSNGQVFGGIFGVAPAVLDTAEGEQSRWTIKPATCASSEGGDAMTETSSDERTGLGEGRASCPVPGGRLEASASAALVGGVRVGRAYANTSVHKDSKGLHAQVIAGAEDIDIANGLIRIAEIRSVARSSSNGRPKKGPMSTYEMAIRGVRVQGRELCPSDGECNPALVVDELNRIVAGQARFRLAGGLDERLLTGTPKGSLTAVQKSPERQASDRMLVGDFTTDVPALEVVVYQDNTEWGRARQLYQFAGVASSATYNISLIPSGSGLSSEDDEGDGAFGSDAKAGDDDPGDGVPTGFLSAPGDDDSVEVEFSQSSEPAAGRSLLDRIADAVERVGRGLRLFLMNPRQALLLLSAWALLGLPAALGRRYRRLADIPFE